MLNLSSKQLRKAASIKDRVETLQGQLDALLNGSSAPKAPKRWKMSKAARMKIAAAQRARWAKVRG